MYFNTNYPLIVNVIMSISVYSVIVKYPYKSVSK